MGEVLAGSTYRVLTWADTSDIEWARNVRVILIQIILLEFKSVKMHKFATRAKVVRSGTVRVFGREDVFDGKMLPGLEIGGDCN